MVRVLLVDDEYFMIEGLTKYIPWPDLGVDEVLAEDDPTRALAIAYEKKPNILITDIRMPKMDGIELAQRIHEKLPDCNILFLTAYNEKEYLKSAIYLRAVGYLEKPVDREELCAEIRKIASDIKARNEQVSPKTKNRADEKDISTLLNGTKRDMTVLYAARIKEIIDDQYTNSEFTIETIARSVHLSMQYVCRIFKEATDETINSYLVSVRISKAKELIRDEGIRLEDIATRVGYRSPNHFAKIFREHEGVNPSVYRALSRYKTGQ